MKRLLDRHPWLLVLFAFAILLTAWTSLIVVALKNQPEKVPLEPVSQMEEPARK